MYGLWKHVPHVSSERKLERRRAAEKRRQEAEKFSHIHSVLVGADAMMTREDLLRVLYIPRNDLTIEENIPQIRDVYAYHNALNHIRKAYTPPEPKRRKISLETYRSRKNVEVIPETTVVDSGYQPVQNGYVNPEKLLEEFEGFVDAQSGRIPSTTNGLHWVVNNSNTDTLTALIQDFQTEHEERKEQEIRRDSIKRKRNIDRDECSSTAPKIKSVRGC